MKEVRTHLSDEEYEFVKERPRSFMRTLVQDRMKAPEFVEPDPRMLGVVVPVLQLFQNEIIDRDEVREMLGLPQAHRTDDVVYVRKLVDQ